MGKQNEMAEYINYVGSYVAGEVRAVLEEVRSELAPPEWARKVGFNKDTLVMVGESIRNYVYVPYSPALTSPGWLVEYSTQLMSKEKRGKSYFTFVC